MRALTFFGMVAALTRAQHVVELHATDGVSSNEALKVFQSMGVTAEQANPLLERVAAAGKSVVIQGPKEACERAAAAFSAVGMQAVTRQLTAADKPSEYGDSDVIVADAAKLEELAQDKSGGTLVTFYAPWCGHCIKMVPEFKKAASILKRLGIKTAAVNSDDNHGLAQKLGIRGFPTVRWVYNGAWSEYKAERTSADLVVFATTQAAVAKLKGAAGAAIKGAKLAMSKVLSGASGMGKAVSPGLQVGAVAPA